VVISSNFLQTHNLVGPTKTTLLSTITAIYDVGCFLGSIAASMVGEKLGRKKTILLGTSIMLVGAVLQTSSYSVGQMMTARIISGIGNGFNSSTAPVWQTETATASLRGKLVILENVLLLVGFSLSNWLNYGFSFVQGPVSWRLPLAVQLLFIVSLLFLVPWLPESPR
jgi:MFS family permease